MNGPRTKQWIVGSLSAVVLAGCQTVPLPPTSEFQLGATKVHYRTYRASRANLCEADPTRLEGDVTEMNGLLEGFLEGSDDALNHELPGYEGKVALLREAVEKLPPVLETYEANLGVLQKCPSLDFDLRDVVQKGRSLAQQARGRLTEAPKAIAAADLREEQRKWRAEAEQREKEAKKTWCSKPSADLYFARQAEGGRTEWLFCDGYKVVSVDEEGGRPQLVAPEGDRRKVNGKRYIDAAMSYTESEIEKLPGTELRTYWKLETRRASEEESE